MTSLNARNGRPARPPALYLATSALGALALGVGIYLVDRDWATTMALAPVAGWQWPRLGLFGTAGLVLPSFLHAYAFAVLLVLALDLRPRSRAWICAGWFAIAAALECLQADAVANLVFGPRPGPIEYPLVQSLQLYARHGRFDPADLWATAIGCASAWFVTRAMEKHL
jgi:hypothetical protein